MQQQKISMLTLGAMVVAQVAAFAQQPAVPEEQQVEATDVRSSDGFEGPKGIDDSRTTLAEKFFAWGRQMDIKAKINDELKKNFKGTPEEALRIHLMEIVASEDQAAMGNAISQAAENYRHQCGRGLNTTLHELMTDQVTLQRKNQEIDAALMTLDTGKDATDRQLSDEEMVWVKKRLRTLLNHRSDVTAAIEVDKGNAAFYRDELLALVKLDRYLDGWASDLSAHVERVVDAAERERKSLSLKDVRADREQIRNFAAIFDARVRHEQKIPPPARERVEEHEPGAKKIMEDLQKEPPLTPEEEQLVEAELEKYRQSRQAKTP